MFRQQVAQTEKAREAYVVLWVKNRRTCEGSKAIAILHTLTHDFPDLGEFTVIEVKGNSIGEELPFVATGLGVLRGLKQIEYYAYSERRFRATENAA